MSPPAPGQRCRQRQLLMSDGAQCAVSGCCSAITSEVMAACQVACYAPGPEVAEMAVTEASAFGELLRQWRLARRVSQLDLGLEAAVSARHISFIETGRARPSREMVLMLSEVLDVPLRERNALLLAAGYAPVYRETDLTDPQAAQVRQALVLILRQHEPHAAVAFDRHWNLVMANAGYAHLISFLMGAPGDLFPPLTIIPPPRPNLLRMTFDPAGFRSCIVNWEPVARELISRVRREAVWHQDEALRALLNDLLDSPGIPARWREPDFDSPQNAILPVELRAGDQPLRLFSTITTLGSPQDITLQELRIESFHPVDEETEKVVRSLASQN